jgi:DNA-binding HxlR family transcriptional regulator
MQREVQGITAKMLSKELKELEVNELVLRTVRNTTPVTVEYELTEYGKTLDNVIEELRDWGTKHRRRIIKKNA